MVPNIATTVHDPMLGWVREERLLYSFPVSRQPLEAVRAGSAVYRGDMLHSVWSRAPLARANTGSWWVIFGERKWVTSRERRSARGRCAPSVERTAAACGPLWADAAPRENPPRAVSAARAGPRPAGHVRVPRLHPSLGSVIAGALGGQAEDGARPLHPGRQGRHHVVSAQPARAVAPSAGDVNAEAPGALRLLRDHRELVGDRALPLRGGGDLVQVVAAAVVAVTADVGSLPCVAGAGTRCHRPGPSTPCTVWERTPDQRSRMRESCTSGSVGAPGG